MTMERECLRHVANAVMILVRLGMACRRLSTSRHANSVSLRQRANRAALEIPLHAGLGAAAVEREPETLLPARPLTHLKCGCDWGAETARP